MDYKMLHLFVYIIIAVGSFNGDSQKDNERMADYDCHNQNSGNEMPENVSSNHTPSSSNDSASNNAVNGDLNGFTSKVTERESEKYASPN